ncbi:ABC transporter permease, partial [candidate division KSB1 bacterium]|nr:ABC transporter permease [candidate division KSB1 bacterium]
MFKNYFKIALRNLIRHKTFFFINIFGLAIGITCTILILLWVQDELGFDKFNKNADSIYRVVKYSADEKGASISPAQLAPTLAAQLPEIDSYTRIFKLPRLIFTHENNNFYEDNGILADPAFLSMFTFPLKEGNIQTALDEPVNIVITEKMAKKYFGDTDPIDKTIELAGQNEVKVTGVLKSIPTQSHIQFDFIMPFRVIEILSPHDVQNWGAFNYTTYIQFKENTDVGSITKEMNAIAAIRIPPEVGSFWKKFELQPLDKCYLSANIDNKLFLGSFAVSDDINKVYLFSIIAFFILFLACINFMNLSTAWSGTRTREIGIKKVIGSTQLQLIFQFLGEFLLVSSIALAIAILIIQIILPYFNQISGKEIVINHFKNLGSYFMIILLTTLLGGFYPAFYLSSFKPVRILKGQIFGPSKTNKMRSMLVVFQFSISIILIAGTIVVSEQLQYIHHKKLGFQKDNIVYLHLGGQVGNRYQTMKHELLKNSDILGVTAKDCLPTELRRDLVDYDWETKAPGQDVLMELTGVDYNYFEMLDIKFAEGRSFSEEYATDTTNFVLNEEAVKETGLKSPVGKRFADYNKSGIIVGVIKNTNFKSLREQVNPQVYHIMTHVGAEAELNGVMLIKINGKNQSKALSYIEKVWENFNPNVPFEFHFLDQAYERLYISEQRTMTIINYFSMIAIVIACLGLYGLASFTAEKRSKEIGIRKVLGADVKTILAMFTNDFTKLVLLANFIACPIAFYFMNKWLQNFAYRIDLSIWPFLFSGLLALVIALLTVSW